MEIGQEINDYLSYIEEILVVCNDLEIKFNQ
jgi:hypothetical protein